MQISNVNNTSFGTKFTTGPYPIANKKLEKYLEKGIDLFQNQTKDKPGCMTLRCLDFYDIDLDDKYFFWGSYHAPGKWRLQNVLKYDQRAMTDKKFLKKLIVEREPQEQADILESIFDALQVIPKKIPKKQKQNPVYMKELADKVNEKLGKYKELLGSMFEHIAVGAKKLTIEDNIDF